MSKKDPLSFPNSWKGGDSLDNQLNSEELEDLVEYIKEANKVDPEWDVILGKLYELLQRRQMMEWNI